MLKHYLLLLVFVSSSAFAQKVHWQNVDTKTNASFRGLSVVDDSVAWASGSKGWVGRTVHGGKDWSFAQVKGYEQCDFRSIYAFDTKNAVIANAGTPAYILRTADGGVTWQKVYENSDTAAFIDGIDFWDNKNGVIYGDPIGGRMLFLKTSDGGRTWTEYPADERPVMCDGEASFAASGTTIKCMNRKTLVIATGGKVSRLLVSKNRGKSGDALPMPILQGEASRGIFSFLPLTRKHWVIAGGDYKQDTLRTANLFYTYNAGKTWHAPATTTRGYRECLAAIDKKHTLIAAGPGGVDISYDAGKNWEPLSEEKQFHVVKKSRKGNLIVIAGGGGKMSILTPVKK